MGIRKTTEQIREIPGKIKTIASLAIAALCVAIVALLAAIRHA